MSQSRLGPRLLSPEGACPLKEAENAVHPSSSFPLRLKHLSERMIFKLGFIYLFLGWREPREEGGV